jgi:hypothetical protein
LPSIHDVFPKSQKGPADRKQMWGGNHAGKDGGGGDGGKGGKGGGAPHTPTAAAAAR